MLNPITEAEAEKLLDDTAWWLQEKFDGKRVLVKKDWHDVVTGINRKGLTIGLPEPIIQHAKQITGTFVIDGECVGDKLYAFDCLQRDGIEVSGFVYSKRLEILLGFIKRGAIECAPTAAGPGDKRDLFRFLKQENKEGVVFKLHNAPYVPGRNNNQMKLKFYATASVIVAKPNAGKRSVAILVFDGKRRVAIGNVTIPPNAAIPAAGSIIEVRYLNAIPNGSLYQPVFWGIRDDISPEACTVAQLKFKPTEDEDA